MAISPLPNAAIVPTRNGPCQPGGHICHVVEDGEDDNVWWLGFDCSHSGDMAPGWEHYSGTYRDMAYVTAAVEHLAAKAYEVAP